MRLGNKWGEIAKLMGCAKEMIKYNWKFILKTRGIKISNISPDELKNSVKEIIAALKQELHGLNTRSHTPGSNRVFKKIQATSPLKPIDESHKRSEDSVTDSVNKSLSSIESIESLKNVVDVNHRLSIKSCNSGEPIPSQVGLRRKSNEITIRNLLKESLRTIDGESRLNEAMLNKQRLTTESEEYDFALDTEEGVDVGTNLSLSLKIKNFATIIAPKASLRPNTCRIASHI